MDIKKELTNLFLLSTSTLHISDKLICCTVPGSVSVPHSSGMTYVGLFGAEWQEQHPSCWKTGVWQAPGRCHACAEQRLSFHHAQHIPAAAQPKTQCCLLLKAWHLCTSHHLTDVWDLADKSAPKKSCLVGFKPSLPCSEPECLMDPSIYYNLPVISDLLIKFSMQPIITQKWTNQLLDPLTGQHMFQSWTSGLRNAWGHAEGCSTKPQHCPPVSACCFTSADTVSAAEFQIKHVSLPDSLEVFPVCVITESLSKNRKKPYSLVQTFTSSWTE